jgi:CubicO group peptidase (beta-lactamase class C family)
MHRRTFLAATAATLAAPALRAQPAPPDAEPLVRRYMQQFDVPGLSLTFARGERILYTGCFGLADRETRRPVRPDSLFRIASNSKAFTSAAIFLLVESGKLALNDRPLAPDGVLREYASLGRQQDLLHAITIRDLLTHTAGGWSNDGNDPMFERPQLDQDGLIRWTLQTHALQNPPGQKYAYSNFGYCLLGRVIEHASGERYAAFVHQRVLRVPQAEDMRIGARQPAPGEVRYYGQGGEKPYVFPIARMDSHGGWIATSRDMARFLASLFSPQDDERAAPIVSAQSLREMTAGSQANRQYGCGLELNAAGNAWHNGSLPGTMSIMVHTRSGMSWACVVNTRSRDDAALSRLDSMLWEVARSVPQWRA